MQHRHRTGRGQIVDSSLYEAVLQVMESLVIDYSVSGHVRERTGAILPGIAPSNVYRCRDGDYLIGANQDTVFVRLCSAIGQPDLADDPRFADHASRGRHQRMLDEIIECWTSARSIVEVEAAMIAHAIPAGRVYRAPDMVADPHFQARKSLLDIDHPRLGPIKMQNAFPFLSETPGSVRRLAPATPGVDNWEVLHEVLGLSEADYRRLVANGTV
ncbi:CaiB/BaiF CoA transferase family protein [Stakelama tenebrarum]|uniref:CaiB/BaiF CoA transferase family protein n=1 Tax=Stakelama tenebrarum TaxID=2711215 RepID=UPI001D1899AD|nr:CaiB/BaiF CoA-transferase family protein [Sphingosinithalassobacter tenebrarum]